MEKKPFPIDINGQKVQLLPDNCGVALFRNRPEVDYFDYWEPTADGEENHTWVFNSYVARWLGGLALHTQDQKDLRLAEREHGTFKSKAGWNPMVIIEDEPSETEMELYAQKLIGHALDSDANLHKDLNAALKEDF